MQCHVVQCNAMQCKSIQTQPTASSTVLSSPRPFHSIPSVPISSIPTPSNLLLRSSPAYLLHHIKEPPNLTHTWHMFLPRRTWNTPTSLTWSLTSWGGIACRSTGASNPSGPPLGTPKSRYLPSTNASLPSRTSDGQQNVQN